MGKVNKHDPRIKTGQFNNAVYDKYKNSFSEGDGDEGNPWNKPREIFIPQREKNKNPRAMMPRPGESHQAYRVRMRKKKQLFSPVPALRLNSVLSGALWLMLMQDAVGFSQEAARIRESRRKGIGVLRYEEAERRHREKMREQKWKPKIVIVDDQTDDGEVDIETFDAESSGDAQSQAGGDTKKKPFPEVIEHFANELSGSSKNLVRELSYFSSIQEEVEYFFPQPSGSAWPLPGAAAGEAIPVAEKEPLLPPETSPADNGEAMHVALEYARNVVHRVVDHWHGVLGAGNGYDHASQIEEEIMGGLEETIREYEGIGHVSIDMDLDDAIDMDELERGISSLPRIDDQEERSTGVPEEGWWPWIVTSAWEIGRKFGGLIFRHRGKVAGLVLIATVYELYRTYSGNERDIYSDTLNQVISDDDIRTFKKVIEESVGDLSGLDKQAQVQRVMEALEEHAPIIYNYDNAVRGLRLSGAAEVELDESFDMTTAEPTETLTAEKTKLKRAKRGAKEALFQVIPQNLFEQNMLKKAHDGIMYGLATGPRSPLHEPTALSRAITHVRRTYGDDREEKSQYERDTGEGAVAIIQKGFSESFKAYTRTEKPVDDRESAINIGVSYGWSEGQAVGASRGYYEVSNKQTDNNEQSASSEEEDWGDDNLIIDSNRQLNSPGIAVDQTDSKEPEDAVSYEDRIVEGIYEHKEREVLAAAAAYPSLRKEAFNFAKMLLKKQAIYEDPEEIFVYVEEKNSEGIGRELERLNLVDLVIRGFYSKKDASLLPSWRRLFFKLYERVWIIDKNTRLYRRSLLTAPAIKKMLRENDFHHYYIGKLDYFFEANNQKISNAVETKFLHSLIEQRSKGKISQEGFYLLSNAYDLTKSEAGGMSVDGTALNIDLKGDGSSIYKARLDIMRFDIFSHFSSDIVIFRNRLDDKLIVYLPGADSPLLEFNSHKEMKIFVVNEFKKDGGQLFLSHFSIKDRNAILKRIIAEEYIHESNKPIYEFLGWSLEDVVDFQGYSGTPGSAPPPREVVVENSKITGNFLVEIATGLQKRAYEDAKAIIRQYSDLVREAWLKFFDELSDNFVLTFGPLGPLVAAGRMGVSIEGIVNGKTPETRAQAWQGLREGMTDLAVEAASEGVGTAVGGARRVTKKMKQALPSEVQRMGKWVAPANKKPNTWPPGKMAWPSAKHERRQFNKLYIAHAQKIDKGIFEIATSNQLLEGADANARKLINADRDFWNQQFKKLLDADDLDLGTLMYQKQLFEAAHNRKANAIAHGKLSESVPRPSYRFCRSDTCEPGPSRQQGAPSEAKKALIKGKPGGVDDLNYEQYLNNDELRLKHNGFGEPDLSTTLGAAMVANRGELMWENTKKFYQNPTLQKEKAIPIPSEKLVQQVKNGDESGLFKMVFKNRSGLILGERHTDPAAFQSLIKNMDDLKAQGVDTIFLEGLLMDFHQSLLDKDFLEATKLLKKAPNLQPDNIQLNPIIELHSASRLQNYPGVPPVANVIRAAYARGIKIVSLDSISTHRGLEMGPNIVLLGASAHLEPRAKGFNFFASQVINSYIDSGKTSKFVAVVGGKHLIEDASTNTKWGLASLVPRSLGMKIDSASGTLTPDLNAYMGGDTSMTSIFGNMLGREKKGAIWVYVRKRD